VGPQRAALSVRSRLSQYGVKVAWGVAAPHCLPAASVRVAHGLVAGARGTFPNTGPRE
jgi:hypothetical protein